MTHPHFNEAAWIARLAVALEDVAANARPSYSPLPPELMRSGPTEERQSILYRGYRALAARAKHDPTALSQFKESNLWVETDPAEAKAILREHPLIKPGLDGSGKNEGVKFRIINRTYSADLKWLVACLAKLSVKEGGECAARRLHRYLTAGENASIPAHEITVFHGVVVKGHLELGAGAYLAPYEHAKVEFNLPDEPELFPKTSYPNAAVLVRSLSSGPGVVPCGDDDRDGLHHLKIGYRFPTEYQIDLGGWFDEKRLFVSLLSIAARTPLLTRTRYVCMAEWVGEIDPNFSFYTLDSGGNTHDVWPKGRDLSQDDADAFVSLAHGWIKHGRARKVSLAIHRFAASFSRSGGRFGTEDRVLDTAIALEIMYGLDGSGLTDKLSTRAAWLLGGSAEERRQIFDEVKSFYKVRSDIVHGNVDKKPDPDKFWKALKNGHNVACRTFSELLSREPITDWKKLIFGEESSSLDVPS